MQLPQLLFVFRTFGHFMFCLCANCLSVSLRVQLPMRPIPDQRGTLCCAVLCVINALWLCTHTHTALTAPHKTVIIHLYIYIYSVPNVHVSYWMNWEANWLLEYSRVQCENVWTKYVAFGTQSNRTIENAATINHSPYIFVYVTNYALIIIIIIGGGGGGSVIIRTYGASTCTDEIIMNDTRSSE